MGTDTVLTEAVLWHEEEQNVLNLKQLNHNDIKTSILAAKS